MLVVQCRYFSSLQRLSTAADNVTWCILWRIEQFLRNISRVHSLSLSKISDPSRCLRLCPNHQDHLQVGWHTLGDDSKQHDAKRSFSKHQDWLTTCQASRSVLVLPWGSVNPSVRRAAHALTLTVAVRSSEAPYCSPGCPLLAEACQVIPYLLLQNPVTRTFWNDHIFM